MNNQEANIKTGWISLYRSIRNHWLWPTNKYSHFEAWVFLLLEANHANSKMYFDGSLITIHRGQIITSLTKLSLQWKWSREKVKRYLKSLEDDKMITLLTTQKMTQIIICNYASYQDNLATEKQLNGSRKATDEQLTGTNNNYNNDNNINNGNNKIFYSSEKNFSDQNSLFNYLIQDPNFLIGHANLVRKEPDYILMKLRIFVFKVLKKSYRPNESFDRPLHQITEHFKNWLLGIVKDERESEIERQGHVSEEVLETSTN